MRIQSNEQYKAAYKKSVENPEIFWEEIAEQFSWRKKWDKVLDWNFTEPNIKWFVNGKLNITENCLDRHAEKTPNKIAFYFEPNNPANQSRSITYKELYTEVCKFANVLKKNGAKKGDRICIYMPMTIEAVVAMLACARIGAIHSVVFGGFSANALAGRINDCECTLLITADSVYRGSKPVQLKEIADEALLSCSSIKRVIVLKHIGNSINMVAERDVFWHAEMQNVSAVCEAETMDSEDILFILYTSGSTGKPKGVVHSTGGYMVFSQYTFQNVFQYNENEIFWCTADVGWITGHSYIVYGPLLAGATQVIFEGIPTYPDAGRFWQIIDRYKVTIFYTAPTAIRALEAAGLDYVKPYKLDSLRVLGSVGEPINEEAWQWYHKNIGKEKCPIADTWWQTETGGIMISSLAGITPQKPGFATLPLPGIQPILIDEKGNEIKGNGVEGNLCIKFPWPGMIRTTYGDHERCKQTYFSTYKNLYFTGDGCKRDLDGLYRITGRVDDVINVSGHRIGTAEVESAINLHPIIVESAVVGFPHNIKGQGIYAYVISVDTNYDNEKLKVEILDMINKEIGAIAKPDKVQIVSGLPKTRSGKIMRRILRKIAEGDTSHLGDTSTLLDPKVVEEIKKNAL
ncbi:MAG: acetate--CoA ligase [Flavobacteriales bacterium]|nr:acetate--CoA ligase [Flavobacteriales bacterium]